jgi:hypothetical protein
MVRLRLLLSSLRFESVDLIPLPIDFAFQAMDERSDRAPARWRRPLLRWLDGVEAGWAVPLLIACFVAVWTLYLAIAYAGGGLHPDTLEAWTLGRNFAFGYHKHPPLKHDGIKFDILNF